MNLGLEIKKIIKEGDGNWILSTGLLILSWVYGFGHHLRLGLYKSGILKIRSLPVPVISVGNITAGGTGKTPAVIMIADILTKMGIKVAILSRGYKGRAGGEINVVSDSNRIFMKALQSGDEPYMMALKLKGIPVITSPDRHRAGIYAIEEFGADVILMDDGYQHIQLNRKLNILLLDSSSPFGNGYLLPRGVLREPACHINRADVIIFTKSELRTQNPEPRTLKDIPICKSRYITEGFFDMNSKRDITLNKASGKGGFAFCGIASPDSFRKSLEESGIIIKGFVSFDDHYQFNRRDIDNLIKRAGETNSEILITTEKDAVRLIEFEPIPFPVWTMKIRMEIFEGEEMLLTKIKKSLKF